MTLQWIATGGGRAACGGYAFVDAGMGHLGIEAARATLDG